MFDVTENPFVYGEVVPAAAFVDRVVELDRLTRDLNAGQKVFLISPRRYGKSSLIRHALAAVRRRGTLTVEVTVSSFSSYVAFLEGYARALMAAESAWERARSWLREATRLSRSTCSVEGFAPSWVRLNKTEIRITGSMSPRARAKLAAMRMAFRVAAIARSFDTGHLAFLFRPRCNSQGDWGWPTSLACYGNNITPLNRRD